MLLPTPYPNLPQQDVQRLPEGMKRVGYDADTQTYTFRDADGTLYESAPGCRFGELTPVRSRDVESAPASPSDERRVGRYKGTASTFEEIEARHGSTSSGNGAREMLPFALLVLIVLLGVFRLVNGEFWADGIGEQVLDCGQGGRQVQVERGDSCWTVAGREGLGVEELLRLTGNEVVECEGLRVGERICVPE